MKYVYYSNQFNLQKKYLLLFSFNFNVSILFRRKIIRYFN